LAVEHPNEEKCSGAKYLSFAEEYRSLLTLLNWTRMKIIASKAGATTTAVTEKVWGEYVSVACQILSEIQR